MPYLVTVLSPAPGLLILWGEEWAQVLISQQNLFDHIQRRCHCNDWAELQAGWHLEKNKQEESKLACKKAENKTPIQAQLASQPVSLLPSAILTFPVTSG